MWPRGQFNKPFQICKQAEPELEPLKCKTGFNKMTHEYVLLCLSTLYKSCTGKKAERHTPCDIYLILGV